MQEPEFDNQELTIVALNGSLDINHLMERIELEYTLLIIQETGNGSKYTITKEIFDFPINIWLNSKVGKMDLPTLGGELAILKSKMR